MQFGVECDLVQYENKVKTTERVHLLNLKVKIGLKVSKTIPKGPHADKCNMHWNANLKESEEKKLNVLDWFIIFEEKWEVGI
jgi:hypothetical protein